MSTPAPVAPAAPAAAGTTPDAAPAAPKSLLEAQREASKTARNKPVDGPSQGSFVKVGGKTMAGPTKPAPIAPQMDAKPTTAGEKAGAPVAAPKAEAAPEAPAPEAPKPDAFAELKKGFDAKSRELADLRKQMSEYENLGKSDFKTLVSKLAEYYKADPQAIAEALLMDKANAWAREQELAKLSPEERALREKAERWEKHEAAQKVETEKQAAAEKEAVGRRSYEATTNKMIEAHKLLPEAIRGNQDFNGKAALRIRDRLLTMAVAADPEMPAEQFLASVDPAKLAAEAMAEYRAELKLALLTADDTGLDEMLTPEIGERWTRKLASQAKQRAHPALTAQPRAGNGQFKKDQGDEKPAPKPLNAMKPPLSAFLPKRSR
jgi:hypothetical protein